MEDNEKHLTIKDKVLEIQCLISNLKTKVGYCLNEFEGTSTPEKQSSESEMDYDLEQIIHSLKEILANLYIG